MQYIREGSSNCVGSRACLISPAYDFMGACNQRERFGVFIVEPSLVDTRSVRIAPARAVRMSIAILRSL